MPLANSKRDKGEMALQGSIEPTGNPLDLDDKEHCSVVLTTDTMKVQVEGKFRQRERKLFVLLVHSVWNEIGSKRQHTVEVEKLKQVFREVAGVKGFNNWIWEYLENLAEIKIIFENERYRGVTRLLSYVKADKDTGDVTFEIPSEIEKGIKSPTQFARLDTYFLIGLKGKYSVSLYQLLESKINLRKFNPKQTPDEKERFIEIDLEQLRGWLNINHGEYRDWYNFNKRVLSPAIEEINSNPLASTFTVRTEEVRGARRKVKAIRFFLSKTSERLHLEKSIHTTKNAKKAAEASFLIPPFKGTKVYESAKKQAKGLDVYQLEIEWRELVKERNKPIQNPEGAFIGFVKRRAGEQNSSGLLGSIFGRFASNE